MFMNRTLLCAITFACIGAVPAAAQTLPSMSSILQSVFSMRSYSGVAISSRGNAVAWEEATTAGGLTHPVRETALFIRNGSNPPVRLTAGDPKSYYDESNPVWSPDGSRVAFLSNALRSQQQIFIASSDGSGVRRLTNLTGAAQSLRWSPDGRYLAMLYIAHPHRSAGALAAGARQVGVIGSVVDEQRLTIVDASTGTLRALTPADAYVYEYGWAPDSNRIAYTYAYGSGDNNWWVARLAIASVQGGSRDLLRPGFQINDPEWSPDGRIIAVIGGLMSDFGSVGGDVYLVNAATGKVRDVAPGMALSASAIRWTGNARMLMLAHELGSLELFRLNASTGAISPIGFRGETLSSLSATPDGSGVAFVRTSFGRSTEVWAGAPRSPRQITDGNAYAPRFWSKAISMRWRDGAYRPQGWLIYPANFDSHKRYPLVMIVHGGPSAESLPSHSSTFVAGLTSHGYFVFEPNPRGSFGQGEAYARANVKDFGYGDWHDDLAGIDAAIATGHVDPNRLGLFGWSYGGYMAMWGETQTSRFKAIVAGAGVVNWQSYYGQNDIDEWMIPFFGASVYEDPGVYARSSPITFITHSHTPVLVLQGERDEEVPAPQAFEFYHAMKTLGVPSQLVVYADEGHAPRKPANQIDVLVRMVAWFDRYLR
jgi:dipeptidyl aminopeptidase/acylaminoacyl peptidase